MRVVNLPASSSGFNWDVASDDERFLVIVEAGDEETEVTDEDQTQGANTIHIIANWFTELKRLAPPEGE